MADVLVGDARGAPRHDFTGRLAFSWPRTAGDTGANRSGRPDDGFGSGVGYGLTYRERRATPALGEAPGLSAPEANFSNYLVQGRAQPPWRLLLRHGERTEPVAAAAEQGDLDQVVSLRAVDAGGLQEGGRQLSRSGGDRGEVAIVGPALDMRMLSNGEAALQLRYRLDEKPTAPTRLAMRCGAGCAGAVDLTPTLLQARPGEWHSMKVKLTCFRDAGADVSKVTEPFALNTSGRLRLSVSGVQLTSDPAGSVCPPAVN